MPIFASKSRKIAYSKGQHPHKFVSGLVTVGVLSKIFEQNFKRTNTVLKKHMQPNNYQMFLQIATQQNGTCCRYFQCSDHQKRHAPTSYAENY